MCVTLGCIPVSDCRADASKNAAYVVRSSDMALWAPRSLINTFKKEFKLTETQMSGRSWPRAIGIGLAVAVLTAIVAVILTKIGVSPFPKPPSLAFADTLLGRELPLPVGLLFHAAYVTFWSVVFVRFFPQRNLKTALALALALWLVIIAVFFPMVGWGFAGLHISPKLIPASLVPHALFGILLWGLDKYLPGTTSRVS